MMRRNKKSGHPLIDNVEDLSPKTNAPMKLTPSNIWNFIAESVSFHIEPKNMLLIQENDLDKTWTLTFKSAEEKRRNRNQNLIRWIFGKKTSSIEKLNSILKKKKKPDEKYFFLSNVVVTAEKKLTPEMSEYEETIERLDCFSEILEVLLNCKGLQKIVFFRIHQNEISAKRGY